MLNGSTLLKLVFLCAILCAAFWIRIQSVDTIPEGQFTSVDAYFYYWQASLIFEHGQLPERDMQKSNPKYLKTGFPQIDETLQLQ